MQLALEAGSAVEVGSIAVEADAGGLRARERGGDELTAHEALWFAWSQFHRDTSVWAPIGP